jgi:hypothetical protein
LLRKRGAGPEQGEEASGRQGCEAATEKCGHGALFLRFHSVVDPRRCNGFNLHEAESTWQDIESTWLSQRALRAYKGAMSEAPLLPAWLRRRTVGKPA